MVALLAAHEEWAEAWMALLGYFAVICYVN